MTVEYHNQEKRLKDVEIEKLKAEFNALQAQVNPHFLFNTLNNLYGLILEKSNKSGFHAQHLNDRGGDKSAIEPGKLVSPELSIGHITDRSRDAGPPKKCCAHRGPISLPT